MKTIILFNKRIALVLIFIFLLIVAEAKAGSIIQHNRYSLTFINVTAVPLVDSGASVKWTVERQANTGLYEIEKSIDGINFIKIGEVPFIESSTLQTSYDWNDTNAIAPSIYYRVVSIDNKADMEYSKEVQVSYADIDNGGIPDITVFPNPVPANQMIKLQTINIPDGVYTVSLVNTAGQVVWVQELDHTGKNSVETIAEGFNIPAGIYYMTITGHNNDRFNLKIDIF
jgi:hypothetical protein